MKATSQNDALNSTTFGKKTASFLLFGFAVLVLIVVVLRRFLEPRVSSLSGISKWTSQALIVGTAIYALFVPPYDKERRRLSGAGVVTIFSLLIAFGAFALSDWKDRVAAKIAADQRQDQITKLSIINDAQKEALTGIRTVSAQQAETSSKLTEQAKAQNQLVNDAQNLLKGQGLQLQRQEETIRGQVRTLSEVARGQQLLGHFELNSLIYIPSDAPIIKPWLDRLHPFFPPFRMSPRHVGVANKPYTLPQILQNADLRPKKDSPSESSAANLLLPAGKGSVDMGTAGGSSHEGAPVELEIYFRFYRKGRVPNYNPDDPDNIPDLTLSESGTASLFFETVSLTTEGLRKRVSGIFGFLADEKPRSDYKGAKIISRKDFGDATVVVEVTGFQLASVTISSQGRRLKIAGFAPVSGHEGMFVARIPSDPNWR